jgi:SAM-dependent methyltransferase
VSTSPTGRSFLTHAPEATRRIGDIYPGDRQRGIDEAERSLAQVVWQNDVDVAAWAVSSPLAGIVALACLADVPATLVGRRIAEVLPELSGLCVPPRVVTYEHQKPASEGRPTPLLDRVIRALRVALPLSHELSRTSRALLTTALLFSDVAKGGTPEQRETWRARLGVDGTVHNEDSAVILEDVMRRVLSKAPLSEDGRFADRARILCSSSGLCGMRLRGEVSRDALGPLLDFAKEEPDGGEELGRVWSIMNRAETSAVREGLWTDALASEFAEEERAILLTSSSRDLARAPLSGRIARMRGGALSTREPPHEVEQALDRLQGARAILEGRLSRAQVWYAEAALGALSLDACVRLLLFLSGSAVREKIETSRTWHLDLLGLVRELRDEDGAPRRYPVRLLETLLEATKTERLMQGHLGPELDGSAETPLVSFPSAKGGEHALAVSLRTSDEASALLTLLSVYEKKHAPAFHQTLKALCDLYGLRKDDFDRVANEASYLATMNAARSDKSRMLDFVAPGTIVEVGPGGGVVLDLLAERFPGSRIVGLDASESVVEALTERRAGGSPKRWEVVHGDAFQMTEIFGRGELSTVIFCSVLHEIFSYVPWGDPPKRFSFASVEAIVAAAFRALGPKGRIVVRDGVMPTDERRIIELRDDAWLQGFELFAKSYEARPVPFEKIGPRRYELSQRDLYEFLTTFTWGPDSFPYEIREQRAVLPRDEYVARLVAACEKSEPGARAREVPVPADLASYLQPGYPENVEPHVAIFDATGEKRVPMPNVNGVWVLERIS